MLASGARQFSVVKDGVKSLNEPVTVRKAAIALGIVAVLASLWFGGRAAWRVYQAAPKSSAAVKDQVRSYLKKQSHVKNFASSYDFKLRATVIDLQTNALKLREEVNLLRTNLMNAQKEFVVLNRDTMDTVERQRATKRAASMLGESLSERERRLAAKELDLSVARSNLSRAETNTAAGEARLSSLRANAALAETNVFLVKTNVAGLRADLTTKEEILPKISEEAAAKQTALTNKQTEIKTLKEKVTARETVLAELRRELNGKEQALQYQHQNFAREARTNIMAAPTYEFIYAWLGRLLWTSDQLLASKEFADRRAGAMLAEDAAAYSMQNAENYWLAARISEGWLWPNLDQYDAPGKPKVGAPQVLQTCVSAFRRAGETNNVIKSYQLELQYANSPRALDRVRYNLGNAFEDKGDFANALKVYREIQDTNFLRYAEQRIASIERRTGKK
jgi:hypothetical protein